MTFPLEYHKSVQRSISASPALLGMLLLPLLFLSSISLAQLTSSASSGSSHGSSAPASAASFAHNGYAPPSQAVTHFAGEPHSTGSPHNTSEHHHHPRNSADGTPYFYPYFYAVPVPYTADATDTDTDNDAATSGDDDAEYQGGPTVFDRRGSGPASYVPPDYQGPAHASGTTGQYQQSATESAPEPPPIPTTLVFKDGHQLTVENYAIVGQTLYDLTSGHPRKIAVADLDLPATEKQNGDHGVDFHPPASGQGN